MPIKHELFIANRLYFSRQNEDGRSNAARPAVRVALAGIIIGVVVMIITIGVVVGFKRTVTEKVAGFGAHVQVVNFDNNNTYEMQPVVVSDSLVEVLSQLPHVQSVHRFLTKPGIIKTDEAFQGVVFKGTDYWDWFASNLYAGTLPQQPSEVLLSREQARALKIGVGESFFCYFVDEDVRVRKLVVSGLYATGFGEFDAVFVIGMPQVVRQLNRWNETQVSGIEVMAEHLRFLDDVADEVYFATANRLDENGNAFYTQTLEQLNPQIFSWLDLLDMNVVVIIFLMLCVSGFNIISGLIILILDSIKLIGTLKSLGADNRFVRRIFITEAAMLIGKGVLWGNAIGLVLCAIQYFTHLIPLDSTTYYVSYVPVAFPWLGWLALNIGTIAVSLLILLAPSAIVTKISPAKVLHFE